MCRWTRNASGTGPSIRSRPARTTSSIDRRKHRSSLTGAWWRRGASSCSSALARDRVEGAGCATAVKACRCQRAGSCPPAVSPLAERRLLLAECPHDRAPPAVPIVLNRARRKENRMSSQAVRDPVGDPLLTPANCALILIDYQPIQVKSVGSMDRDLLVDNIVRVAKIARAYRVPVVLSTVNVTTGRNEPTIPRLLEALGAVTPIDRTAINAWEDRDF